MRTNWINWFEIAALDIQRAKTFYEAIFNIELFETELFDTKMAIFPSEQNGFGGAIVQGPDYSPANSGNLLYLNAGSELNEIISRIDKAGGKIVLPKTMISEDMGYFSLFIDSEGNKLALHSIQD